MNTPTLSDLGWSDHFARQLEDGDTPARVAEVHRSLLVALTPDGPVRLAAPSGAGSFAVGDWVGMRDGAARVRLAPKGEIARKAAGRTVARQLVAANVDTLGIVTSCNADFNAARLERYVALAAASDCLPLVILTKADLAEDPRAYLRQAERLSPLVTALALDARDADEAARLVPWCGPGQTLALVGSSGVGKTTLQNALTGGAEATAGIREDDAKGRHTTTYRALRRCAAGGWLIDTPGMRELQLADSSEGIDEVFEDITDLAAACRFSDCAHETEPGCAVRAALEAGELEPERLARWRKLEAEDRHNSETLAQARARHRGFAKKIRAIQRDSRRRKGD
ncbi:ribosome small subunit-dependent GTPase A [Limimaricola pyoseonensis]|uniref:Small ribosomal subunit biogenesis GTPase RsgA n=1 Tax=Limimaricola pyoseonensis TaxID=521013 RepID=A0A1G7I503_9RHOB|nr:ribosome small subunit-dependent GTPase A [Limimaricola pyoseonensis]SDF07514.1 ribosome biogenesis GTPase [Limimaricola pyoseonensis]